MYYPAGRVLDKLLPWHSSVLATIFTACFQGLLVGAAGINTAPVSIITVPVASSFLNLLKDYSGSVGNRHIPPDAASLPSDIDIQVDDFRLGFVAMTLIRFVSICKEATARLNAVFVISVRKELCAAFSL